MLWISLALTLTGLVILLTLPLWFPWMLGAVTQRVGIQYQSYRRLGMNRIVLREVQARFGNTVVRAQRVELPLPQRWAWQRFASGPVADPLVRIDQWTLRVEPKATQTPGKIRSTGAMLDKIDALWPKLQRWLPAARLTKW